MADETTPQTVLNLGGWSTRTVIYVAMGVFVLGGFIGAWTYHTVTDSAWLTKLHDMELKLTAEKNKPPVIKEVVRTQTQTEVAYVPKETVIYRDTKTGRELTATELDSMNLNVRPSDFYFTVNGKPQKFSKTDDERWVFDKNKLAINQSSTASIDIKVPTVDRTKRTGIGIYGSTESAGVFVTSGSMLLMGGYKYNGGVSVGAGIQARF